MTRLITDLISSLENLLYTLACTIPIDVKILYNQL